jgi:hypothetical protein
MSFFKEYLKENFAYKKITGLRKRDSDGIVNISIFPNGRLFDMSGEPFSDETIDKVWKILYKMGKEGKLDVFEEK